MSNPLIPLNPKTTGVLDKEPVTNAVVIRAIVFVIVVVPTTISVNVLIWNIALKVGSL